MMAMIDMMMIMMIMTVMTMGNGGDYYNGGGSVAITMMKMNMLVVMITITMMRMKMLVVVCSREWADPAEMLMRVLTVILGMRMHEYDNEDAAGAC